MTESSYLNPDLEILNLCADLQNWKSEITYHDMENQFYLKLFSSQLIKKTEISEDNIQYLNRELMNLDDDMDGLIQDVHTTLLQLENHFGKNAKNIPDSFLQNCQDLKIRLHNYSFRNRKLKVLIYSYLSQQIKSFL